MKKKKKTLEIHAPEGCLLWEAMRRMLCMGQKKSVDDNMLGLGYKTDYKSGIKTGLFVPSFGQNKDRCKGWYKLTPLGQKLVKQLIRKIIFPKDCHTVISYVTGEFIVMI